MFESIMNFFKKLGKSENKETKSKETAKERLHLVLMQDRANVSADFLEMMKQEIIEVIKKYIEVDEKEIDVRLTNEVREDGTTGAPSLYANIPIMNIKNEMKKSNIEKPKEEKNNEENEEENVEEANSNETNLEKEEDVKIENHLEEKLDNVEEKIEDNEEQDDKKVENKEEQESKACEEKDEDLKSENNEDKSGE